MAIMITGATGFLGRHLVRHMVDAGETDLVLMDAVPNRAAIADVAHRVRLVPGDVRETTAIVDTIRKYRIEGIIHLAAFLGTGGLRNPIPSINVNLVGTNNVFEAARLSGVRRVVYMSSNAIYPERRTLDGPRFDEDDPPGPDATNLVYGACKLFNEHIARYYMEAFGLDPIGIRPTSVFGEGRGQRRGAPGDHFMVAPELAYLGKPVTMPPAEQVSDWIYVRDAAEVFMRAYRVEDPAHRVLNMAGECRKSGEINEHLRALYPQAPLSVSNEPLVMNSLLNTGRLRETLDFTPRYSVEEGIELYIEDVKRRESA